MKTEINKWSNLSGGKKERKIMFLKKLYLT